mgnify:CR=1 FL=1
MSKSLKNFIKIRSVLEHVSPRILRIFYNLKNYDATLNYNPDDNFVQAWNIDKQFDEFFALMRFKLRDGYDLIDKNSQKLNEFDLSEMTRFETVKKRIHSKLQNNLHIPACI